MRSVADVLLLSSGFREHLLRMLETSISGDTFQIHGQRSWSSTYANMTTLFSPVCLLFLSPVRFTEKEVHVHRDFHHSSQLSPLWSLIRALFPEHLTESGFSKIIITSIVNADQMALNRGTRNKEQCSLKGEIFLHEYFGIC